MSEKSATQNLFAAREPNASIGRPVQQPLVNNELKKSIVGTDKDIYTQVIDMTLARTDAQAYEVNIPFRGFLVAKIRHTAGTFGDDLFTEVKIRLEKNVSGGDYLEGGGGFSYSGETVYSKCYISHEARSGYELVIQFYKNGGGLKHGLSKANNSAVSMLPTTTVQQNPALNALAATLICSYDSYSRSTFIQNNTGATIYLGDSTVTDSGATKGLELINGATIIVETRSSIYVYSVSARAAGLLNILEFRGI